VVVTMVKGNNPFSYNTMIVIRGDEDGLINEKRLSSLMVGVKYSFLSLTGCWMDGYTNPIPSSKRRHHIMVPVA